MAAPELTLEQAFAERLRALDGVNATLTDEITKLKTENAAQQKIIEQVRARLLVAIEQLNKALKMEG